MSRTDHNEKFKQFRKQYPVFIFDSYSVLIEKERIVLKYSFNLSDKYFFHPEISILRKPFIVSDNLTEDKIRNIAFHIGMIEMLSYWKATCSPKIVIKPHFLNSDQLLWWKEIYYKGLGEFLYLNSIHVTKDELVEFEIGSGETLQKQKYILDSSSIIPVGGGKDSVVTIELIGKTHNTDNIALILNPRGASLETSKIGGFASDKVFEIYRNIDSELLKMNSEGFLNGHTPFSVLLGFICLLASVLCGKRNIVLSNESSANESTVEGTDVNHQYSKTFEFEAKFRKYISDYISDDLNYFSFLRPLSEMQIAKLFARFPKYFDIFKSCNAGSKTDEWCGNCSKCLFVYIILSPFISRDKMIKIFGKDLFDDISLLLFLQQLCGIEKVKPFECVGTIDEVNAALCMTIENINSEKTPVLLEYYKSSEKFEQYRQNNFENILKNYNTDHFLEPQFEEILKSALNG